jgi:cellulase/cellobiase CelA1
VARKHLLVVLVLLCGACTTEPPGSPSSLPESMKPPTLINEVVPPQDVLTVVRDVIDARTVELADGTKVRVALLAPPAECWAAEALTFAKNTLLARSVRFSGIAPGEVNLALEDGTDYALLAVLQGALRPEGVDGGALVSAEKEAAAAKAGLWGPPCDGTTKAVIAPTTTPPPAATTTTPPAPPAQTTTTPPPPAPACAVSYRLKGQWPNGFQASVDVRNTGATTLNGWSLSWTFRSGQVVTEMWNATQRQSGATVVASNVDYNVQIAPGATVPIGFNAATRGPNAAPTAFTLNGVRCSVE